MFYPKFRMLFCMTLTMFIFLQQNMGIGSVDERWNEIKQQTKQNWLQTRTLNIQGEEYQSDEKGDKLNKNTIPYMNIKYIYAGSGRRWLETWSEDGNGNKKFQNKKIENGKYEHQFIPDSHNPSSIAVIHKNNQVNTDLNYKGEMNIFLWVWTPGGKPIYEWFEQAERTNSITYSQNNVILKNSYKNHDMLIELDHSHNWMPLKISISDSKTWSVLQYDEIGGQYYPARAIKSDISKKTNKQTYHTFNATSIRVNEILERNEFDVEKTKEGPTIFDKTKGSRKNTVSKVKDTRDGTFQEAAIRDETASNSLFILRGSIAVVSGLVLIAAIGMKIRRSYLRQMQ